MTYNVFSGTLNPTQSINMAAFCLLFDKNVNDDFGCCFACLALVQSV